MSSDKIIRIRPSSAKDANGSKMRFNRANSDMVSYEDLIVAQYLEQLRANRSKVSQKRPPPTSPYLSKISPHSSWKPRPRSANIHGRPPVHGKPKIDAKFIADTNLWDPMSPSPSGDQGSRVKSGGKQRPVSAPVRRARPFSGSSTYSGRHRLSWRPSSGRRSSLYKQQPHTIVALAYRNGSRDTVSQVAAPNMKILLEWCTDKLSLPFAARRVFLEGGTEVYCAEDIEKGADIYISMGENYRDPYAEVKQNTINQKGATWALGGVVLPEEGKPKPVKTKMSKRMRSLLEKKRVRIVIFRNGKSTEPVEIVADQSNMQEFLVGCTVKLDLPSHARILYTLEGQEIQDLNETPALDDCLQHGGTPVLGPLWVSTGEGFNPTSARDYTVTTLTFINKKLTDANKYKKQLEFAKDDEKNKVTIVSILSMNDDEIYEALDVTEQDIDDLTQSVKNLKKSQDKLNEQISEQMDEGAGYTMKHIKKMDSDDRLVGIKGLRLKIYENGQSENETIFYFNMRGGVRGIGNDKSRLMQRLLDDLSQSCRTTHTQHPKLNPIAKKIYDKFGNEITDVMSLEYDQEIWLSFGEAFICPFTYCFQLSCDKVRVYDVIGEGQVMLRETLTNDDCEDQDVTKLEASIGFPMMYDDQMTINRDLQPEEYKHFSMTRETTEIDGRSHFLQSVKDPNLVLYPELVVGEKMKKGSNSMWPPDSQLWMISKSGYMYCRGLPQMCVGVSDVRVTAPTSRDRKVDGFLVNMQKKMVDNPNQKWIFNNDGTLSCQEHSDLVLTYLGNKNGDEESEITNNIEGTKSGHKVFLVVCDRLENKDAVLQRFALKQERFDNLGQWKHTDGTNPEFSKQAYSWPTKQNGTINEDYDWPMEAYLIPSAPPLHKKPDKNGLSGMPKRLLAVRNGERDSSSAVHVVGPDLTNLLKEAMKHTERQNKKDGRPQESTSDLDDFHLNQEVIDADIMLHCQQTTVRQLEFVMFLDHSTALLNLPFAGRRLFDENGAEHLSLSNLTRDDLVYVSCGEPWTDPLLTKVEQQRRFLLSQLSHDIEQIQHFVALRNPRDYVLEIDGQLASNSLLTVNKQWTSHDTQRDTTLDDNNRTRDETYRDIESEIDWANMTAHEKSHQRADERAEQLKWPWERLQNATDQFYWSDPDALKYTDKEMYEKYKPQAKKRAPRDNLQRFQFQDGFLMSSANNDLVLGVHEYQGHKNRVMLVKKRLDDVNQRWMMSENGEIALKYSHQVVLTVNYPTMQQHTNDQSNATDFVGTAITVQNKKTTRFGRGNQIWRYDAETGFIAAFSTDPLDKEITAANKTDVCTYTVAGFASLNQPGYIATVSIANKFGDEKPRDIRVCTSCARAMRGRYKLTKVKDTDSFACAMGQAKKLKLKQIGSFRVLNGKVDLSTHEADLTLENWEAQYSKLKEETSVRAIATEISAANVIVAVKVLAYKNGEGRLRAGEYIVSSSIEGLLTQCTQRLDLPFAATKIYTEDGTVILDLSDLKSWAVDNYRRLMWHQVDNLIQGGSKDHVDYGEDDVNDTAPNRTESQIDDLVSETLANIDTINMEAQGQSADDMQTNGQEDVDETKRRDYIMSQMSLPSVETILRYPIEIWVSTGKVFISPDAVESKTINKKKQRMFRSAISLELDIEKHIARQLKGRRLEDLNPGEYKPTFSSSNPVVREGNWDKASNSEQLKKDNVKKLNNHYAEVKTNQNDTASLRTANFDLTHRLYRQPVMKRVLVYPNGESVDRAQYVFGETTQDILCEATSKLGLWKNGKFLFTEAGKIVTDFDDIERDQLLCVSHGTSFKKVRSHMQQEVEIKANWSRARKKYGQSATDYAVISVKNPQVHVDPFGPPQLALPVDEATT